MREAGIGGDFKDRAAEPGAWQIGAMAFGEILPRHENKVTLDKSKRDKWGLPVLAIDCETGENERLMREDMKNDMAEMLEAAGVRSVTTYDRGYAMGMGIHEMGTARMGNDPRTSVLNRWNQVWDAPNVFVTDGSCHGVVVVRESVVDVHGADGARRRSCGRRALAAQSLIGRGAGMAEPHSKTIS